MGFRVEGSRLRGTPIQTLTYDIPYYRDPRKVPLTLGNLQVVIGKDSSETPASPEDWGTCIHFLFGPTDALIRSSGPFMFLAPFCFFGGRKGLYL